MHTISRLGLSLGVFLCLLLPITEIQAASQNNLQNKSTATDGSRVALLIGNGDYRSLYLKDAVPSVRQLEGVLRELGFEVARLENSTQKQLKRSIDDFGRRLSQGGIGFFYYFGHAMAHDSGNYLIPVDAFADSENEVEYDAVRSSRVLAQMESAKTSTNLLVLDACHGNPFSRYFQPRNKGLVPMTSPANTLIAYSRAPGCNLDDSPADLYVLELIRHLSMPGLDVEELFQKVRSEVYRKSGSKQIPWDASSLTGKVYLNPENAEKMVASAIGGSEISEEKDPFKAARLRNLESMKKTFSQAFGYEKRNISPSLKIEAWRCFLLEFAGDNPFSNDDERMREEAHKRIAHWETALVEPDTESLAAEARAAAFRIEPDPSAVQGPIFLDPNTQLMWQREDDGLQRSWLEAADYCEALELSGYGDWRLPKIAELTDIVDPHEYDPAINVDLFTNTKTSTYWSSTEDEDDLDYALHVNFKCGYMFHYEKTGRDYVRCVRMNP